MSESNPVSMLCIFRIPKENESLFRSLLRRHWATLDEAGLVTAQPAQVMRGVNKAGKLMFIEMFQWKGEDSSEIAHQTPEVLQVWEPMGALCEGMEFIRIDPVDL